MFAPTFALARPCAAAASLLSQAGCRALAGRWQSSDHQPWPVVVVPFEYPVGVPS
jgi:hypothetical protein